MGLSLHIGAGLDSVQCTADPIHLKSGHPHFPRPFAAFPPCRVGVEVCWRDIQQGRGLRYTPRTYLTPELG